MIWYVLTSSFAFSQSLLRLRHWDCRQEVWPFWHEMGLLYGWQTSHFGEGLTMTTVTCPFILRRGLKILLTGLVTPPSSRTFHSLRAALEKKISLINSMRLDRHGSNTPRMTYSCIPPCNRSFGGSGPLTKHQAHCKVWNGHERQATGSRRDAPSLRSKTAREKLYLARASTVSETWHVMLPPANCERYRQKLCNPHWKVVRF